MFSCFRIGLKFVEIPPPKPAAADFKFIGIRQFFRRNRKESVIADLLDFVGFRVFACIFPVFETAGYSVSANFGNA